MGKRLSTAKSIFLARLIADVRAGHAPAAFNAVHAISAATGSTNLGTVFLELDTALSEYCRPPHEQAAACCGMLPPDLLAEALAVELGRGPVRPARARRRQRAAAALCGGCRTRCPRAAASS